MGLPHIERLRHIRHLLSAQGRHGASQAQLVCYGGGGFTDQLREAAETDPAIVLVSVEDIYRAD